MDKDVFQDINNNLRQDKEDLLKSNEQKDKIIESLQNKLLDNVDSLNNAQKGIGSAFGNVSNVIKKSTPSNVH